jgi:general L-amino acid transport system permease protein
MAVDTVRAAPVTAPIGAWAWLRANLFSSPLNSFLTLVGVGVLALILPPLLRWGVINAAWSGGLEACKAIQGTGACWVFIGEKYRLMLFGLYPYEEQWRPLLMVVILIALLVASMNRAFWRPWLGYAWIAGYLAMGVLMWGGVLGLPFVETDKWGGLPLTLILTVNAIVFSFPLAIALALGRRSDLPVIRTLCIFFIEIVRGVPLLSVLFVSSLMIPLFLPSGMDVNKLLRAQIGIILFTGAYVAEVIRGGLQALPKGQMEAADSLGLGYWQKTGFIVLPQALSLVIPPMVNSFIATFKDTSLVIIIGLFDLFGSARMAANDPSWRPFYVEGLLFVALIYFVFCYSLATYSRYLEKLARRGDVR